MTNSALIIKFYESFASAEADAMAGCYADDTTFTDPAFGELKGADAKNMWRMLNKSNDSLKKYNASK